MGRPKDSKTDEVEKIFEKSCEKIIVDGRIAAPSTEIWVELHRQMPWKKTSKSVYGAAKRWHNGLKTKKVDEIDEKSGLLDETSGLTTTDGDDESDHSEKNEQKAKSKKKIKIEISP